MVDYKLQTSRGDPLSAENRMSIYQYPNRGETDNECENAMLDALEVACDQLYNNGVVGYYEISITYDHPNLGNEDSTSGCDGWGMLDEFREYLEPKNPPVGSHLLATGYISYGCGQLGNDGATPFNSNWQACVMGTELAKQFWKNGGIHEVHHNYLDSSVITDSYIEQNQHDLGKLYCSGTDETSPMCTSYENTAGDRGYCSDNCDFDQAYVTDLTYCTVDGMDQTASYY